MASEYRLLYEALCIWEKGCQGEELNDTEKAVFAGVQAGNMVGVGMATSEHTGQEVVEGLKTHLKEEMEKEN